MEYLQKLYFFDRALQFDRVGDTVWVLLMLVGFYYIYQQKKDLMNQVIVFPSFIYTIFILNPFTSYVLSEKMDFSSRMYRFMWVYPGLLIVGYVGADLLDKINSKGKRCFLITFILVITFFTGNVKTSVYTTENIYKVQNELLLISELLHGDKEGIISVFFEDENLFLTSVQYDPEISVSLRAQEQISTKINEAKEKNEMLDTIEFYELVENTEVEYLVLHKETNVFGGNQYEEFISETEKNKIYKLRDVE